jgi:DNA-binding NarL/FixJ family response regulator
MELRPPDVPDARSACDHDALEYAIVLCLVEFAKVVSASGEPDRLARLCAVLEEFGIDPASRGIEPAWMARDSRCSKPRTSISGREQEVAALIAEGLTNREIAETLVISERTADTHVQNILGKLGLASRAQVAAWYVEQGSRALRSSRSTFDGRLGRPRSAVSRPSANR